MDTKLLVAPKIDEAWYTVPEEMEAALVTHAGYDKCTHPAGITAKIFNRFLRIAMKSRRFQQKPLYRLPKRGNTNYLAVTVGISPKRYLPYFLFTENNSLYLFDAWPDTLAELDFYSTQLSIKTIFFTIRQAAEEFAKQRPDVRCIWIPEGVTPENYHFLPYKDKNIDVLEFGRKYDLYHDKVAPPLLEKGRVHLYEKIKGQVVFPTAQDFADGLARTKITINFPGNVTHPKRSGNYETVTMRYFSSMSAKCLILGQAPEELKILFGYDPVIPADMNDPAGQIENILNNFDTYIPLIEKNYKTVCESHTWADRARQIQKYLLQT